MPPEKMKTVFVWLVALHSYGVGLALIFLTRWGLGFGGFEAESYFFARQGGVFHLLVATVYLVEFRRYGTLDFMVLAKATATVFLFCSTALGEPWVVALSGLGDGSMLVAALVVRRLGRGGAPQHR
jgi:hypothetical protein